MKHIRQKATKIFRPENSTLNQPVPCSNYKTCRSAANDITKGKMMENVKDMPQPDERAFRLKFVGKMTYEHYRELESKVMDSIRRYKNLEIDLSEVVSVDLCGLHLIGLLQSAGVIVATSDVVEQASRNLLATLHSSALGRAKRSNRVSMSRV